MELRQRFFSYYSNMIRSVIDLKYQVQCEKLCYWEMLNLQPYSWNSLEQNMFYRAYPASWAVWLVGNGNYIRNTPSAFWNLSCTILPFCFRKGISSWKITAFVDEIPSSFHTHTQKKTSQCSDDYFLNWELCLWGSVHKNYPTVSRFTVFSVEI